MDKAEVKVQSGVPIELLMGNKPVRPAGVKKDSGNRCTGKQLEDVYYKDETVNKKQKN